MTIQPGAAVRSAAAVAAAVWLSAAAALAGDVVRAAEGGALSQPVTGIWGEKIVFANNTYLPLNKATQIEFDRFAVAAGASGIVLADGSRLSGVVRSMRKVIVFRSVALGEVTLPTDQVAAIYYEPAGADRAVAPAVVAPCVCTRKGETLSGKVLWADTASVGLMTKDGMRKLAADTVSFVKLGNAAATRLLALRNGDVVNGVDAFEGTHVRVKLGGTMLRLPLAAVMTIKLPAAAPAAAGEPAK